MGYAVAENFRRTHGGGIAIENFLKLLNAKIEYASHGKRKKRRLTLREISEKMGLSPSQVCRLKRGMFELQYVNQVGTQECLNNEKRFYERKVEQLDNFIEEQKKLQFIPGRVNESHRA